MDTTQELPTVLSLCTGYGGIEDGLTRAGVYHRVLAHVEIEAFAVANLVNKMEQGRMVPAPVWTNLKTLPVGIFRGATDLITGGYPCQPFSSAGKRAGTDDPRHLWPYIREAIRIISPARVFFENVEGHISLGLSRVLNDLEELGYKTTWGIFSAREVGAPHQRKRVYIMGDSKYTGLHGSKITGGTKKTSNDNEEGKTTTCESTGAGKSYSCGNIPGEFTITESKRVQRLWAGGKQESDTHGQEKLSVRTGEGPQYARWKAEPNVGRVVNGCPDRVDRIRLLGNGVVPQTAAKAWVTLNKELTL